MADVVIVGGGASGIFSAFCLAKAGLSVVILEKNHLVTGDTGFSTGFLTRVPDANLSRLRKAYGADFISRVFAAYSSAQQELFSIIINQKINCDFSICSGYYGAYEKNDPILIKEWNAVPRAGSNSSWVESKKENKNQPNFENHWPFAEAIKFAEEGQCDVHALMSNFVGLLPKGQVRIFEESEVLEIKPGEKIEAVTSGGSVSAKHLILAMNDPTNLVPELKNLATANLTYALAARYEHLPVARDIFWDIGSPYFYFRTAEKNTVVVGGLDKELSKKSKANEIDPYRGLESFLRQNLPGQFTITNFWSGTIYNTVDNLPFVFALPHYGGKILVATGFSGNGLVGSFLSARLLTNLIIGVKDPIEMIFSPFRAGIKILEPKKVKKSGKKPTGFLPVAKKSDFKKDRLCRMIRGEKIVIFKVDEQYFAIEGICSHAGGSLEEGTLAGKTVTCPLHGAKFDVATGRVEGPPAVRDVKKYPLRVVGENIEIAFGPITEKDISSSSPPRKKLPAVVWFYFFALGFWLLELAYQYQVNGGLSPYVFLRSASFTGANFIGFALLSSIVFKFWPSTSRHWRFRRYLGVVGVFFILVHILLAENFVFDWALDKVYFSLNPFNNPVVFGSLALPIFLAMALTSSDWAVQKMTFRWWKFVHRFVYLAYVFMIFHFSLMAPQQLDSWPGYFLLSTTGLVLVGELYWWVSTLVKKRFRTWGLPVGLLIIVLYIFLAYFAWFH